MNVMEYYENMNYCPACKERKALEIIKKKKVNVLTFRFARSLDVYNKIMLKEQKLTQDEYALLKEVLL